jgi:hypothetical protein
MKRRSGRRPRLLLFLPALCLLLLGAAPAHAAPVKPYVAVVSNVDPAHPDAVASTAPPTPVPSSAPAGSRTKLRVTLYNYNDQQALGSANVTVPTGLTYVSSSANVAAPVAVPDGLTFQLRNLALPKDASGGVAPPSFSFTVTLDASCGAGGTAPQWAVVAKQANNFNGVPGNVVTQATTPPSSLTTQIAGSCSLLFVGQPTRAAATRAAPDAVVSNDPLNPSGNPVAVAVVDGSGARVARSGDLITLTIEAAASFGRGVLDPKGASATTIQGLATFPALTVNPPSKTVSAAGSYVLRATSGTLSTLSQLFQVWEQSATCQPGSACDLAGLTGTANSPTTASISAPPAAPDTARSSLAASFGVERASTAIDARGSLLSCPNPNVPTTDITLTPASETFYADSTSTQRTVTVTLTIDKFWVNLNANNGAAFLPVCFGASKSFYTASGDHVAKPQGTFDYNGDGVPETQFVGLLAACADVPASAGPQPCVDKRFKNGANGVIVVTYPGAFGDPKMHG